MDKIMKKPKVVITRKLPEKVETRMCELFETTLNHDDHPFTTEELLHSMQYADVLVPTLTDKIDAKLLAQAAPNLKLIANYGAGFDHIDVQTARQRGIIVTNTPGVLAEDTADMAMAMMLAISRGMAQGLKAMQHPNQWQGWSPTAFLGNRLGGKRLGIIGMGRVGTAIARRAKAFGLQIHYHNRNRLPTHVTASLEATYWDSLDQMLARMDILSINCPSTPATYHLLSARRLSVISKHCYIVNTARGDVIDENALIRMLENGDIAGAALDVFKHEPTPNPKLFELENVILLPHMSSATMESRIEMGEKVIVNIKTLMDGHQPPDRILPSML
jgi:glyoxylate reductase